MNSFSGLLNNSALMLILCVIYDTFGIYSIPNKNLKNFFLGSLVGLIAIIVMLNPWSIQPGVFFDTRWVLLSLCGLFFGFTPTAIAVLLAGSFRLYQGGPGGTVGTIVIIVTACVGVAWRRWRKEEHTPINWKELYVFGLFVQLAMLSCMFLMPAGMRMTIIKAVAPPILVIYPLLTMLIGLILQRQEDRRVIERDLLENRKTIIKERGLLKEVINTIPDLIFFKTVEGRYLGCNKAFEAFVESDEQSILGKKASDLFSPDTAKSFAQAENDMFASEKAVINEEWATYPDGNKVFLDTVRTPFRGLDGTLHGLVGISRNITSRKKAEEGLRLSEGRLRTLVHTIPDLIWLKDCNGVYLSCNPLFERFFGAKEADIVGKTDYDFVEPELADFFVENDRISMTAEKPTINEEWITFSDNGHRALLETTKTPVYDNKGKVIGVLGIGHDITEQRKAETEKAKLETQLQQTQKLEAIGALAGGVAHDFNNMLGVIIGHTEMAIDQIAPTEPIFEDLTQILHAGKRSADITAQLLAFARKQPVSPRIIDLNETVEGMLNMLRRLIGEDINLIWSPGKELWPINIDPSQVDQILVNLSINARAAIAGIGKITVETKNVTLDDNYVACHIDAHPGDFVQITVSDNGNGMEEQTLLHVFEPFFTTKDVGEGTGLGLATVFGAVKQNGGFIDVESKLETGTIFTIQLPRYSGCDTHQTIEPTSQLIQHGNETILVVEDEPQILRMTTKILGRLGYNVLSANSPNQAISLSRDHSGEIHLLITDVIMPGMNGRDLSDLLLQESPETKCLFMSGYTANIISNQGALDNKIDFIQKPFTKNELATKVRDTLAEK